jgi:hypothetical protein
MICSWRSVYTFKCESSDKHLTKRTQPLKEADVSTSQRSEIKKAVRTLFHNSVIL